MVSLVARNCWRSRSTRRSPSRTLIRRTAAGGVPAPAAKARKWNRSGPAATRRAGKRRWSSMSDSPQTTERASWDRDVEATSPAQATPASAATTTSAASSRRQPRIHEPPGRVLVSRMADATTATPAAPTIPPWPNHGAGDPQPVSSCDRTASSRALAAGVRW